MRQFQLESLDEIETSILTCSMRLGLANVGVYVGGEAARGTLELSKGMLSAIIVRNPEKVISLKEKISRHLDKVNAAAAENN